MKILSYSDLHLEFGHSWVLPPDIDGDILVLAGDIISFNDYSPFERLLQNWKKPVLYLAGNHEYYTRSSMNVELEAFKLWAAASLPNIRVLNDESTVIDDVQFFGGTMWTNFEGGNATGMALAEMKMNDFRLIHNGSGDPLTAQDTIVMHNRFVEKLKIWLQPSPASKRVIISHHAPAPNPNTRHAGSDLTPAFVSTDIVPLIEQHQPDLWIYGHTHECDDQMVGQCRILSNQLGYPNRLGGYETADFDQHGKPVNL